MTIFGFTGNVVLPTTDQVQSGVAFGSNGLSTGSLILSGSTSYAC